MGHLQPGAGRPLFQCGEKVNYTPQAVWGLVAERQRGCGGYNTAAGGSGNEPRKEGNGGWWRYWGQQEGMERWAWRRQFEGDVGILEMWKGVCRAKNILQTSFPAPGLMCSLNESIRETGTKTVEIKRILFWEMKEKFWQKNPQSTQSQSTFVSKTYKCSKN